MSYFGGVSFERQLMASVAIVASIAVASPACAQARRFNVPTQAAETGIPAFAKQAGIQLLAGADSVRGRRTGAVMGSYTVEEGLRRLLHGTGLAAAPGTNGTGIITIRATNGNVQRSPSATAPPSAGEAVVESGASGTESAEETENQIIVTARKREERLLDVPQTINVFNEQKLLDNRISTISDLQNLTPGLRYSTSGESEFQFISLRGVGATNFSNQVPLAVGYFIDGVALPNSQFLSLPFFDVEQVTVLKGPQGTLYGKNTLAGAINIITRRPTDTFEARVRGEYGSYDTYSVFGSVSGPLVEGRLRGRLGAFYEDDGGSFEDASGDALNPKKTAAVRGRLTWEASERLDVDVNAYGLSQDTTNGNFFITKDLVNVSDASLLSITDIAVTSDNLFLTTAARYDLQEQDAYGANLKTDWQFSDFTLTSISQFDRLETTSNSVAGFVFASPPNFIPFVIPAGNTTSSKTTSYTQELRLAGNGEHVRWLVGAFYNHEDFKVDVLSQQIGQAMSDGNRDTLAAFFDVAVDVTDRLEIGGGLRYDHEKARQVSARGASIPLHLEVVSKAWQPKFTARYGMTDHLNVYANIARGFRAGSFNQLLAVISRPGVPDTFEKETLWTYEVGLRGETPDRRFSYAASAFYHDDWSPVVSSFISLGPALIVPVQTLAKKAEAWGLEGEFQLIVSDSLSFSGNASYLHTELVANNPTTPATTLAEGEPLILAPEWTASLTGTFNRPVSSSVNFRLSATVAGVGRTYFNTTRSARDPATGMLSQVSQDPYALLNLTASLDINERYTVSVFGANVLDQRYLLLALGLGRSNGGVVIGEPSRFGVRLEAKF